MIHLVLVCTILVLQKPVWYPRLAVKNDAIVIKESEELTKFLKKIWE